MPWILPLVTVAAGVAQTAISASKAKKAQKALEDQANSYQPNSSIMDYYSKALQRYNTNPTKSPTYKYAEASGQKGLATGLNYLQDRRSALAGVAPMVQNYQDNMLKAAAQAEQQQGQELGALGGATGAKAQEEKYPFEMKYNLNALKAGAANQGVNAGLSNAYSGLQSMGQYSMMKDFYGSGGKTSSGFGGTRYGQMYWGK